VGGGGVQQMTITELADIIQRQIIVTYYPNQSNRWAASFRHCEIKTGTHGLLSESGNGSSPEVAIKNYIESIKGKTMVFDAMDPQKRREFGVPNSLTFGGEK
jgi:hypothetical protein